ncbi:MAG: Hpt domain-containing protein [Weeksellaceae bacterium]
MTIDVQAYKELYIRTALELVIAIETFTEALQTNPADEHALSELHRAAHSLKSQSLVMGYPHTGRLAKHIEVTLRQYKDTSTQPEKELLILISSTTEKLKKNIGLIKDGEHEENLDTAIAAFKVFEKTQID